MQILITFLPGVVLSSIVGLLAITSGDFFATSSMLFALGFGLLLGTLHNHSWFKQGIEFTACHILRIGVALLGLRIALNDLITLGWSTALLLGFAIVSTICIGIFGAKIFGLPKRFGLLTGSSVGICGASAAIAVASVLPEHKNKERDTLLTIVGVTALSTVAMVLYPVIADQMKLTTSQSAIFFGGAIHDVAQVVGAGYMVSEETGDLATLTKLIRVACLAPVVVVLLFVMRQRIKGCADKAPPKVPLFLVGFIFLMLVNSFVDIPTSVSAPISSLSHYALVISIVAIGMKSNVRDIISVGLKPILLLIIETCWIAALVLSLLPYL